MIKLIFTKGRETFVIEIKGKKIIWKDKIFKDGVQLMPIDFSLKGKIHKEMWDEIERTNKGESYVEYCKAKTEEDLAQIVKQDALSKACMLARVEKIEDEIPTSIPTAVPATSSNTIENANTG